MLHVHVFAAFLVASLKFLFPALTSYDAQSFMQTTVWSCDWLNTLIKGQYIYLYQTVISLKSYRTQFNKQVRVKHVSVQFQMIYFFQQLNCFRKSRKKYYVFETKN